MNQISLIFRFFEQAHSLHPHFFDFTGIGSGFWADLLKRSIAKEYIPTIDNTIKSGARRSISISN